MEDFGFTYLIEFQGSESCYYSISPLFDRELIKSSYAMSSAEISGIVKVVHEKDGQFGVLIRLKNQINERIKKPIFDELFGQREEIRFSEFKQKMESAMR